MSYCHIFLIAIRFGLSLGVSQFILRFVFTKCLLPRLEKLRDRPLDTRHRVLTPYVGLVERILYMTAFMIGAYQFIGVWLGVKAAVRWGALAGHPDRRDIGDDQVWLIGSGLSVLLAFLGAWLVLLKLPCFK